MSARKPLRDYAYDAAMLALGPLERTVVRSSLVPDTPFLDPADFPFTKVLEEGWRDIRAELDAVLGRREDLPAFSEISPDVSVIGDLNWKTYFFYGYGFRSEANCRRCPRTAALLEQVPGLTTAFFSILEPGVRIPPHRGPWKGVLRYHLGLLIPEPQEKCAIEVGGVRAHWREGESMMFDDAYEHAAWNDTASTRVVLFLDVLRPCRMVGSLVNRSVVKVVAWSPFLRDAKRRHEAWERRFEALQHRG